MLDSVRQNIYRNRPCLCNSGKKFKHCCWSKFMKPVWTERSEKYDRKEKAYAKKAYDRAKAKLDNLNKGSEVDFSGDRQFIDTSEQYETNRESTEDKK